MNRLIKYSCWCPEHNATVFSQFLPESEGPITVCPLNENHTNISNVAITKVDDHSVLPVKEIDVSDLDPDYARSKTENVAFDVSAEGWSKHTISWPYMVNILNGQGTAGFAELGDKIEFNVEPTLVGVVGAGAAQGATEIYVDDGIKALFLSKVVFPGMWFQFERGGDPQSPTGPDSSHPGDDEYTIEAFDPDTNKVTLKTGLQTALTAMDLVYLVVKYGEGPLELQPDEMVDIGGSAAGAAPVPPNMPFWIWYYSTSASAKRVIMRINLKYGPQNGT